MRGDGGHGGGVDSRLLGVLVALFFFCGVGVVDDELTERERAGCFGGGDQAVNRLGFTREGVGGRARPGGGERDGARGVGVWAVEERLPPKLPEQHGCAYPAPASSIQCVSSRVTSRGT